MSATPAQRSEMPQSAKDPLMMISAEEKERALAIKSAVEACEEVSNLPDYEYAKLAICCGPEKPMRKILEICYQLDCFRSQYKLREDMDDAMATLRDFFQCQPLLLMDVSYLESEQTYSSSSDMAKMNFDRLHTDAEWRAFQGGCYYWIRSMETDFTAIRNGIVVLNECQGMTMRNFAVAQQERAVMELWAYYPAKHKESVWLNTPTAANLFYAVIKRLVNSELLKSWKLGGQLEGYDGRLSDLFCMPSPEASQEALLKKMEGYLRKRFHNLQTFRLDDA